MGIKDILGNVYFRQHFNNPPDLIQVIGWTKTAEQPETVRKFLYIRKIPLTINHGIFGGSWAIDKEVLEKYKSEIKEPVNRPTPGVYTAMYVSDNEIKYNGSLIPFFEHDNC